MASLEKLSILGIRSFGPQTEQSLSFERPLTLILGDNGCGKSTIIECLRFVTAQKEPSGKGVFIHDPNLTSNPTVKAFVKLVLKDAKGREVGLSKSSQSTRTRTGITTKSLDSTISFKQPGEKKPVSTSNRCADFTPEILRILGVSKAILENVIFCTQEDAHWPMDTDQKLKEKFDQIFDSEKYNKCLKKVQDQRKSLRDEKKIRENELKHLKENKQQAARFRKDLEMKETELETLKKELEDLDSRLGPIKEKLKENEQQERQLAKMHWERDRKSGEIELIEKTERELREKIKKAASEFLGSDADLEQALLNCDVEASNESDLKRQLTQAKINEEKTSRDMSSNQALIGQISKLIEINEQKIVEKDKLILNLASKCGLNDSNPSIKDVSLAIESKRSDLTRIAHDHETEQEKLQTEINHARDDVMGLKNELKQKIISLDEATKEKREINNELQNLEATQDRISQLKVDLVKVNESLDAHVKGNNSKVLEDDYQSHKLSLEECEKNLTQVESELKILRGHSETGSKLNLKRDELNRKTADMTRLRNTHQKTLTEILVNIPEIGFTRAVKSRALFFSDDIRELRNRKMVLEEEITTCKNRVLSIGDLLKQKRIELQKFTDEVNELTGGDELNETVSCAETSLNDYQNEKGTLASSKAIFEKFIKDLESKPCCPLCKRDFDKENESVLLIDELTHEIRNAPAKLEKLNQSVLESQKKLRVLLPLKAKQDLMDKLRNIEIPELQKEEADTKLSIASKRKELDDVKEQLGEKEKSFEICNAMMGDMALLDQLMTDIMKIEKEIKNLEVLLPENWNKDLLVTADERRAKLGEERKVIEKNKEETQQRLIQYNNVLHKLQSQKNKLAEEELALCGRGSQRKQQEDRLVVLDKLIESLQSEIKSINGRIPMLEEIHDEQVLTLKERKDEHKSIVREKQEKLEDVVQRFKIITRLEAEIKEFEKNQESDKLSELREKILQQETEIKGLKLQIESINSKLGDLSAVVVRRHELEDNKSLRMKGKEKKKLLEELEELKKSCGDLNYKTVDKEKHQLKFQEEQISNKKAHNFGRMGEIEHQIKDLTKELNTRYKDVDLAFKKELVELKIADALSTDLLRYAAAMDWAMNEYHKRQMEKVNGIVHEYWRKIYRGNDVDSIQIQTGHGGGSLDSRRVYNYKLVQIKGDVRLDMRNRCSAGQKMLASLIIRMALAEVFSNNCGILTLDEPTTNLDRRNIRHLANTLNEIIETKQNMARSNFQLIVITHDRDFIKELTSVNAVEKYIEVSRDRDGRSVLTVRTADRL